jgi:hypothetical protein
MLDAAIAVLRQLEVFEVFQLIAVSVAAIFIYRYFTSRA